MSSRESRAVFRGSARRRRWSKDRNPPDMSDLRIVLLGKSVSGNSRVGNFLLGRAAFDSEAPPDVVERVGGRLKDRHVMVINCPQLLQTHISLHQITQTVRECVFLSDPGPHAFILVLQHSDFTEEDMRRAKHVLDEFSEEAIKRTIVLTTDGETDDAQGTAVKLNELIEQLTAECGGGHLQLDHEMKRLISGVSQQLEKILRENSGEFLRCDLSAEGSSVDEEQSRSVSSLRTEEADSDGGVRATRQQKLNLVLCGSDETLKNTVSKFIREKKDVELDGRLISLVDLPALFNTRLSEEEVMRQIIRCVSLCHPGVHAFLLIVPDAPLNNEDKAEMEEIQRILGSRINKHMMILIMQNSERQTAELSEETQAVIESFGGQHHVFSPTTQVSTLMENIEQMLEENRGEFFSTETFLEAQMQKLLKYEEMKRKIDSLESHLLPQGSRENTDEVRIVLLGKTGVGKSATGNTILGGNTFKAEASFESVTKESQRESSEINGRHVTVIDTPGLFDTELTNEEIQREISNCISMILPGPHVFLLLIPLGQFTKHEEASVKIIQEMFGEKSLMFTMVLFTRGDDLKDKTIDQCLGKPGSVIRNLIEVCGNRYHVFNNNETGDRTQVCDLLEKIDNMVKANGGSFYSCKMFRQMEREKQEQQMKILMDRLREREEEMKKHEEEKEIMKLMMEEERYNQDKERKRSENELKREIREEEKQKRDIRDEMRRERVTFKHQIEEMRREKEKLQIKYESEIDRRMTRTENERKKREEEFHEREERFITQMQEKEELMKKREEEKESMKMMMEEERQNHDKERKKLQITYELEIDRLMNRTENERKKREEEFNVREEQYKREIKDKEEREEKMCEEMKREREEWDKQKLEEKMRREEEDEKRIQKLKEERERMEREKEDLQSKHEEEENKMKILMEKLNREREELMKKHEEEKERMKKIMEKLNREREELMKKHEEEKERMKKMMDEERQDHDEERKRREEELKREIREKEKQQKEIRDEMRRERETFKNQIEEMRREKEKLQIKYDTETERLMKRIENERKKRQEFNEREERFITIMKEKEEREENIHKAMNREREEWEKQKWQSPTNRLETQTSTERSQMRADNLHHRGSQLSTNELLNSAGARLQTTGNINIVLLGKIRAGKSSTGNTILGENRFPCKRSLSSVTCISSIERSEINGRSVSVIDTPGFFDTNLKKESLSEEFARSVYLSAPGVHAFLFVVPFSRFTEQEEEILTKVQKVYGKDVLKHVIILFTYGDECDRDNIQEEIDGNEVVRRVVEKCQGYHVLNNRDLTDRQQVDDLLTKIDSMIEWNQGYYTNEMYELAQMTTWERTLKFFNRTAL